MSVNHRSRLPFYCLFLSLLLVVGTAHASTDQPFGYRTVATGLEIPWEIEFGPDSLLWVSERPGILSRIDVETGVKQVLLDIRSSVFTKQEAGMLGFCIYPNFADTPWVYVAYTTGTVDSIEKVVDRFTFKDDTLIDPVRIFTLAPAGDFHQGCRLYIDDERKLWITGGDNPGSNLAVDDTWLAGKLLRLNLDGSIPDDNPVPGLPFWSKGHRNIQGFVQLPNGNIWTSEHGNVIEDEINLIVKGGNYGWPFVEGPCDLPDEIEYCDSANVIQPKWSTGDITFAPCGLRYYNHDKFPRLKHSLLQVFLKKAKLMQFTLNEAGDSIVSSHSYLSNSIGRIRDIAISADGRIFLCTSNREPNGYLPFPLDSDDRIVELEEYTADCEMAIVIPSDTVHISAVPGFMRYFSIPITNTGECPRTLVSNYSKVDSNLAYLRGTNWRMPLVLVPGQTYHTQAEFDPAENKEYYQGIVMIFDDTSYHTIHVVGNTQAGMIASADTSITVFLPNNSPVNLPIVFKSVGELPCTIQSMSLQTATPDGFTTDSDPTGTIVPSDSVTVMMRIAFDEPGTYSCKVNLATDSYMSPSVHVIAVRSQPESVAEYTAIHKLTAFPNPFSGTTAVHIPETLLYGTVTITNQLGMVLWTGSASHTSFDVNAMNISGSATATGPLYLTVRKGTEIGTCMLLVLR